MNYVELLAENDKNKAEIESLKKQLEPANIQQFLTFAAIEGMSTKQINEVFTDLHESSINGMAKNKAQQEQIELLTEVVRSPQMASILDWAICGISTNSSSGSPGREVRMNKFYEFKFALDKALEASK